MSDESAELQVGQEIGITKIAEILVSDKKKTKIVLLCRCGTKKIVPLWRVQKGRIRSCGCLRGNPTAIEAFGETKNLLAWSQDERCKVKYVTLVQRLSRGWEPQTAIETATVSKPDCNKYRKNWSPRRRTDEQRLQDDLAYVEKVLESREKKK